MVASMSRQRVAVWLAVAVVVVVAALFMLRVFDDRTIVEPPCVPTGPETCRFTPQR